ncbi:hypothetical protein [Streptomyces sp. NPDC006289]
MKLWARIVTAVRDESPKVCLPGRRPGGERHCANAQAHSTQAGLL